MEDVGELSFGNGAGELGQMKGRLTINMARSVVEVGKNQKVKYKEIFVDIGSRKIQAGEVGCALTAMPYFHIAKKAMVRGIEKMTLQEWRAYQTKNFTKS
jgi:hypothetical protein